MDEMEMQAMSERAPMTRKPVESSNLHSVGYSEDEQILEVEFKGGGLYRYGTISKTLYESFMSAESKGKFFNQSIKGQFPHAKVQR